MLEHGRQGEVDADHSDGSKHHGGFRTIVTRVFRDEVNAEWKKNKIEKCGEPLETWEAGIWACSEPRKGA